MHRRLALRLSLQRLLLLLHLPADRSGACGKRSTLSHTAGAVLLPCLRNACVECLMGSLPAVSARDIPSVLLPDAARHLNRHTSSTSDCPSLQLVTARHLSQMHALSLCTCDTM